ncbi:MAG: hypothetical protein ACOYBR_09565 [Fluviibacter sp.]
MKISIINADMREIRDALAEFADKQTPFAIQTALNNAAFATRRAWIETAKARIDKPKKFTLQAVVIRKATKRDLSVEFSFRPGARRVLRALFEGGEREIKPIEKYAGTPRAVPTSAVDLDRFGNVPQAQYQRLFNQLRKGNRFIVRNPRGRPPGIYGRVGKSLVPFFLFADRTKYTKRFSWDRDIRAVMRKQLATAIPAAIEKALLTANQKAARARRLAAASTR